MSEELKPCPFCGGEAEIAWRVISSVMWYFGICQNVDCQCEGPIDLGESGAIEKWNTRGALATGAVAVGVGDWEGAPGVEPLDKSGNIGYTDSARLE